MLSYLERERAKCLSRMSEAQEFRDQFEHERASWAKGVELQQAKMERLIDEKMEEVQVIEINIRRQKEEIIVMRRQMEKERAEMSRHNMIKQKELEEER